MSSMGNEEFVNIRLLGNGRVYRISIPAPASSVARASASASATSPGMGQFQQVKNIRKEAEVRHAGSPVAYVGLVLSHQ